MPRAVRPGEKNAKEGHVELTTSRKQLLVDGNDETFRHFVHDTLAFSARIEAVRNALASFIGMPGPQYTVLISIAQEPASAGVGINHIAERLHYSAAFVTIEVNKLVAAGLIEKRSNPDDRRRVLLTITPKARSMLNKLAAVQRPVNDTLFSSLSASDFDRLRKKMKELVDTAEQALALAGFMSEGKRTRRAE
jgi:DNA-binding MarR family transcriptional regulator